MKTLILAIAIGALALPTAALAQHPPGHSQGQGHGSGNNRPPQHANRPGQTPPGQNNRPGTPQRPPQQASRPPASHGPSRPPVNNKKYYPDRDYRAGPVSGRHRIDRNTRIYRGSNGRYYCRRNDGSTGLIVGAAIGGVLGNTLGDGDSALLSTILGAGIGGALGREIDRGNVYCQ